MTVIKIDDLAKHLHKALDESARKGLLSAAHRVVEVIQTELIPSASPPPIFDGVYAAGWQARATNQGAEVYNTTPYASIIENGARAENIKVGRAMIEALTSWVRRKGIAGRSLGISGARGRAPTKPVLDESVRIAWAIAMAMKTRGIFNGGRGLRIAEKAQARAPAIVKEEIAREMKKRLSG